MSLCDSFAAVFGISEYFNTQIFLANRKLVEFRLSFHKSFQVFIWWGTFLSNTKNYTTEANKQEFRLLIIVRGILCPSIHSFWKFPRAITKQVLMNYSFFTSGVTWMLLQFLAFSVFLTVAKRHQRWIASFVQ